MNTKRMLADVLWEAANVYLSPSGLKHDGAPYSCWAIYMALQGSRTLPEIFGYDVFGGGAAWDFIRGMHGGRRLNVDSMFWPDGQKAYDPQGNRYMWLLLAMHVAEDEGITV